MADPSKIVVLSPTELEQLIERAVDRALSRKPRDNGIEKDWLKAGEASQLYSLPKTWFEERGRAGEIARAKPGRYVLFKRRDIEEYLEKAKKGLDTN